MIVSRDRGGYIGASDVDKVVGNWKTDTWMKWWMQKLSINTDHFDTVYTLAGTHFEHRILESLGIWMEYDRQIIREDLLLRVNLDGNTDDCIYECKTHKLTDKPWTPPNKYIHQVQVQMFATSIHKAEIVAYGMEDADYINFLREIDPGRLTRHDVPYDAEWVDTVFLPKLTILADCLTKGVVPDAAVV